MKWGILGPGRIAHKFAQDLLTLPDAELFAVASSDQGRADDFARQYHIPHAFGHYGDLLTLPDLDVVYVATPHVRHHADALMLLRGGVAVLGEKPFAMNLAEVSEMVTVARQEGVFLMEALWSRFMPALIQAKTLLDDGAIGTVTMLRADFGFNAPFLPDKRLFNKALGGGSLLDIGIYPLFLAYYLLGKPASLQATATFGPTGVDEQCGIILQYDGGQLALLDSTLRVRTRCEAFVFGTEGHLHLPPRWHETNALTLARPDQPDQSFAFPRATFGYDYEARHVMDCLAENRTESPLWSLDDSLNLITLLDQVRAVAGIIYS
jgi:predicted dehydrogenase